VAKAKRRMPFYAGQKPFCLRQRKGGGSFRSRGEANLEVDFPCQCGKDPSRGTGIPGKSYGGTRIGRLSKQKRDAISAAVFQGEGRRKLSPGQKRKRKKRCGGGATFFQPRGGGRFFGADNKVGEKGEERSSIICHTMHKKEKSSRAHLYKLGKGEGNL